MAEDADKVKPPLRLAVAMNGGVSLAVWIGGVAFELARAAAHQNGWDDLLGKRPLKIDVLSGTSAGGINAAFLALNQCYGAELEPLRKMWLDKAGLEPTNGTATQEPHLLRAPSKTNTSLLDGGLFLENLAVAFTDLLKDATPSSKRGTKEIDLRLTTTSLAGKEEELGDDLDAVLHERSHVSSFHFVDGGHEAAGSLRFSDEAERVKLASSLAVAARSTAAFPFAFDPVEIDGDLGGALRGEFDNRLTGACGPFVDGGVLNNLPVNHAIEAVFAMHAGERPERWLVAVVPDPPKRPGDPGATPRTAPSLSKVVVASGVSIPRTQRVSTFIDEMRAHNALMKGRAEARVALLSQPVSDLAAAARTMYPGYVQLRRVAISRQLAYWFGARSHSRVLELLPEELPYFPQRWPYGRSACWGPSVVLRHVALLLQLHTMTNAPEHLREDIHTLREQASRIAARSVPPKNLNVCDLKDNVATRIDTWPAGPGATAETVAIQRAELAELRDRAAALLIRLAIKRSGGATRPQVIEDLHNARPTAQPRVAGQILDAFEVLQGSFADFKHDAEQEMRVALLTPALVAPLDRRKRCGAASKLGGDDLGHFGAFLKRSWRANDWMWGRLDAATFLFNLLDDPDHAPVATQAKIDVQKRIVREEAPHIYEGVLLDRDAGAASKHAPELVGPGRSLEDLPPIPPDLDEDRRWKEVVDSLQLTSVDPERDFLQRCRIGEDKVGDEVWSSLTARVGTRAAATTLGILRRADLPVVKSAVGKLLTPLSLIAVLAHRYAAALRPRRATEGGPAWFARLGAVGAAVLAFADLIGFDLGYVAPIVWTALPALLLTLVLVAPLTTLLTILIVCTAGLATHAPEDWNDGDVPDWLLPLNRWVAFGIVLVALAFIAHPVVDRLDRFLRRILARAEDTTRELLGDDT